MAYAVAATAAAHYEFNVCVNVDEHIQCTQCTHVPTTIMGPKNNISLLDAYIAYITLFYSLHRKNVINNKY